MQPATSGNPLPKWFNIDSVLTNAVEQATLITEYQRGIYREAKDAAKTSLSAAMAKVAENPSLASVIVLTHNELAAGALRVFVDSWASASVSTAAAGKESQPFIPMEAPPPALSLPRDDVRAPPPADHQSTPAARRKNGLTSNDRKRNARAASRQSSILESVQTREEMDKVRATHTAEKRAATAEIKARQAADEARMAAELVDPEDADGISVSHRIVRQLLNELVDSVSSSPPPKKAKTERKFTSPSTSSFYAAVGKAKGPFNAGKR